MQLSPTFIADVTTSVRQANARTAQRIAKHRADTRRAAALHYTLTAIGVALTIACGAGALCLLAACIIY